MNALIGDIGGTKTILAVFSSEKGPREPARRADVSQRAVRDVRSDCLRNPRRRATARRTRVLRRGRPDRQRPGADHEPAVDRRTPSGSRPSSSLSKVALLNDLEAVAHAVDILRPEDIHTLSAGTRVSGGSVGVIAPGTGLGEGFLTSVDGKYTAHASEGSHASFGPVGELQIGLLRYLNQQGYSHVSFERVCSGGLGIPLLYAYLKAIQHADRRGWPNSWRTATTRRP